MLRGLFSETLLSLVCGGNRSLAGRSANVRTYVRRRHLDPGRSRRHVRPSTEASDRFDGGRSECRVIVSRRRVLPCCVVLTPRPAVAAAAFYTIFGLFASIVLGPTCNLYVAARGPLASGSPVSFLPVPRSAARNGNSVIRHVMCGMQKCAAQRAQPAIILRRGVKRNVARDRRLPARNGSKNV
jgi:hypothetical protein